MKTTLFMAMSVNGMIARENGDEDFLSHDNWETFCALANETGNFIVGRKTYEAVKKWTEGHSFDDLDVEKVIISSDASYPLDAGYTLASSPHDALEKLSAKRFENALVTGGGSLNSAFAKANLLDEVLLNVEPAVIGEGIPVFEPLDFSLILELIETKEIKKGIVQLRYSVKK